MSNPYVGEIRMFAGNFAPNGWLFCQGQLLLIDDYDTLFALIGTTYGGDGQNTFALPDLRSRIPVHQGSGYPLAATGGLESVPLSTTQLPVHSHQLFGSAAPATSATPDGTVYASWAGDAYSTTTPTATLAAAAVGYAGGAQSHENMPPFLAVNFIISLFGIYPTPT